MSRKLSMTKIKIHEVQTQLENLAPDDHNGFNQVYKEGAAKRGAGHILQIHRGFVSKIDMVVVDATDRVGQVVSYPLSVVGCRDGR